MYTTYNLYDCAKQQTGWKSQNNDRILHVWPSLTTLQDYRLQLWWPCLFLPHNCLCVKGLFVLWIHINQRYNGCEIHVQKFAYEQNLFWIWIKIRIFSSWKFTIPFTYLSDSLKSLSLRGLVTSTVSPCPGVSNNSLLILRHKVKYLLGVVHILRNYREGRGFANDCIWLRGGGGFWLIIM